MTDSIPKLGTLAPVDLRDVWKSEPYNFTPWLALEDNLNALAVALELPELELIQTERQVSEFSVDIVARITGTDEIVVIENQLERTDHTHLGQSLTYAAGTQARAIVWVAQRFAEGHRAALDWLNRVTSEDIGFFGVEIEAWRIGDSPPAPRFNVVVRPNNWARLVREASTAPSPDASKNIAYWSDFNEMAEAMNLRRNPGKASKGPTSSVQLMRTSSVSAYACGYFARSGKGEFGAYLYLQPDMKETMDQWFDLLSGNQSALEQAFGEPLKLVRRNDRLAWVLCSAQGNPDDEADWPRQHEWIIAHMLKIKALFDTHIAPLLALSNSETE